MLSYKRSVRVGELIQQEVSRIVQELKEPGLGFVTITGLKLTDDLQSARIFYSVIGSDEEVERTGAILKASIPLIRHQISQRVKLRRTPTIEFEFDTTPAHANRIFTLLEQINREPAVPEPKEPPEEPRHKKKKWEKEKS